MIVKINFLGNKTKQKISTLEELWNLLVNGVGMYKLKLAELGVEDIDLPNIDRCLRVDMHVVRKTIDDMRIVEFLVSKINIIDNKTNQLVRSYKINKQDINEIQQIYAEVKGEIM